MAITYKTVLAEAIRGYNNIQTQLHNFNVKHSGVLTYDGTNAVNGLDTTSTTGLVKNVLAAPDLVNAISRLAVINTTNTGTNVTSVNGNNITGVIAYRGSNIEDNSKFSISGTTTVEASYEYKIPEGYYPGTTTIKGSATLPIGAASYSASAGSDQNFTPTLSKITSDGTNSGINIQAATGSVTTTEPSSGYYVAMQSSSGSKTFTATASVDKAGYISIGSKTDNAVCSINNSAITYLPINSASFSTASDSAEFTELTDTITGNTNISSKAAISKTAPAASAGKYFYKFKSEGSATPKSNSAGYIPSGTDTAAATISATGYVVIDAGNATVSGGALTGGTAVTPTVDITLDGQTTTGATIQDSKPSSGYYLTIGAGSSSGSSKVSLGAVTLTKTEGYISGGTTTPIASGSKTVTVNSGSKTEYVVLPSATLANTGTTDVTYKDYAEVNSDFELAAADKYLYLNAGYIPNMKISLGQLIPDISSDAVASHIRMNYKAYDEAGNVITGSMPDGSCTVSGGGLSVTSNYTGTPTVTITSGSDTNMENITITNSNGTKANTTTYPYYFKINASTAKLTGSTTVSRADIKDTYTAGYISARSATTVISGTTSSPSVTVNAASDDEYIGLKAAGFTASGATLTVAESTAAINTNVSTALNISGSIGAPTTTKPTAAGNYYAFTVASTGTVTSNSAGYVPSETTVGTVSKSATTYYAKLTNATLSAAGTATATTTVAPGTVSIAEDETTISGKTRLDITPTTSSSAIGTYYLAVKATAAANTTGTTSSISGTATASVTGAGYAPTSLTGSGSVSGTATAKTSEKSSSVYYLPIKSASITDVQCIASSSSATPEDKGLAKTTTATSGYVYTRVECKAGTITEGYTAGGTIGHSGYHDIKIPAKAGGAISVNTATVSGSTIFNATTTTGIGTASSKSATATAATFTAKDYYLRSDVTAASKGAIGTDNTGTSVDTLLGAAWLRLNGADYTNFSADDNAFTTTTAY